MAKPVAEEYGVRVWDVRFEKEGSLWYLRIFIDKDGGTGIDDCEEFSRAFSDAIDELDPIEAEYILEVSSPGVDRKLKTEREFLHYIGREVDVKLFKAENGKKEFTGILKSFENGTCIIEGDEEIEVNVKDAAYIKLHFEF